MIRVSVGLYAISGILTEKEYLFVYELTVATFRIFTISMCPKYPHEEKKDHPTHFSLAFRHSYFLSVIPILFFLSFPRLRAEALRRAGVEAGIHPRPVFGAPGFQMDPCRLLAGMTEGRIGGPPTTAGMREERDYCRQMVRMMEDRRGRTQPSQPNTESNQLSTFIGKIMKVRL